MASDGRRGDIIRCQTYQPEIKNDNDYAFYLWAQAVQGFFLLKQQFVEGRAQQWWLVGEIEGVVPSATQFEELSDHMREVLDAGIVS